MLADSRRWVVATLPPIFPGLSRERNLPSYFLPATRAARNFPVEDANESFGLNSCAGAYSREGMLWVVINRHDPRSCVRCAISRPNRADSHEQPPRVVHSLARASPSILTLEYADCHVTLIPSKHWPNLHPYHIHGLLIREWMRRARGST